MPDDYAAKLRELAQQKKVLKRTYREPADTTKMQITQEDIDYAVKLYRAQNDKPQAGEGE